MKATLESTTKQITVNGLICRVWEGTTEAGVPIYCIIARVMAPKGTNTREMSKELQENKDPSPEVARMPASANL